MKPGRLIPAILWLPKYHVNDLRYDLVAGLTVTVLLIPQAMAYALLAGMPPIYGLYACIVPLFIYAFLGTSRQLSVGPVALISLLVFAGISPMAKPGSDEFIALAVVTAFLAGLIQILLGAFRLGFLIRFLSKPVIGGFTSAAALIICFSQLKHVLGIDLKRSSHVQDIMLSIAENISHSNPKSILLGLGTILIIFIIKKIKRSFPAALMVVAVGTFVVWQFDLHQQGVAIVGEIPKGLPHFQVPALTIDTFWKLLPLSLTVCLISFIEGLAIAKKIEARHNTYKVRANQELIALGLSKLAGAFFQSYPTSASFTRSAINDEVGARTGISSIISAVIICLTLAFLTPLFKFLPQAVLGGIIIAAVFSLIEYKEAIHLWKLDRRDFLSMLATFLITLTVGVQEGVLTGVILSLAMILYRNSKPHIAIVGRLPNTSHYRNIERFPEAIQHEDVLILRFDAQLYFGNTDYFKFKIQQHVRTRGSKLKLIILDASSIHDVDSAGIESMREVIQMLKLKRIEFFISGAIGPVRDLLFKSGVMDEIGRKNQFMYVHNAMQYYQESLEQSNKGWTPNALQTNVSEEEKL